MAVAQHDNGWWEWEATPEIAAIDGFPSGLADVLKNQQEGMNRWRLGLRRLDSVPYANLLISHHAYWLYAAKTLTDPDPAFAHPLFWKGSPEKLLPGRREEELAFLADIEELQRQWVKALRADAATASWVEPEHLHPHARLLQLLDALSLSLCSALLPARSGKAKGLGEDEFELRDVPRRAWSDRVAIRVTPSANDGLPSPPTRSTRTRCPSRCLPESSTCRRTGQVTSNVVAREAPGGSGVSVQFVSRHQRAEVPQGDHRTSSGVDRNSLSSRRQHDFPANGEMPDFS